MGLCLGSQGGRTLRGWASSYGRGTPVYLLGEVEVDHHAEPDGLVRPQRTRLFGGGEVEERALPLRVDG